MKVLITSAASRLSQELASSLGDRHDVRLTDRSEVSIGRDFVRCELGHDPSTNELVRGMDVIVHPGDAGSGPDVSERLDAAMRCTYNLLWAAAEEGVRRLVYLSSLRILDGYGEGLAVTERWRPVPTTDAADLCHHLGEYVCREFARENRIEVVCLRLGDLAWDVGSPASARSSALYPGDAVAAIEAAMAAELPAAPGTPPSGWGVFHVQSCVPDARYLTTAAQQVLEYNSVRRG